MADEEVEKNAEVEEAPEKEEGGGKSGTLIMIIVAFVVMIATPLICFLIVRMAPQTQIDTESAVTEKKVESIIELKPLLVNIAETKGTRILRIVPHLVLSEARLDEYLKEKVPMLTDKVGLVASRKTINDLEGPQGRESLKRDIMSEINAAIKGKVSGAVINVYFSEFLIQ
ncbi:hypothetical protein DRQ25_14650 [Candidatus Fermentibacteria bacterium]|nr:MAG: hypothetical protein DRQ25_14650 [Candidatus Fermentibacteria bacterium]